MNHADAQKKRLNGAMRLSCLAGIILLLLKLYAYRLTHSAAILSDCSESVIHIFAVGFATYSMALSLKPADHNHHYGHDKISFFSAGFEGAMIVIAALYIIHESMMKLLYGAALENVQAGIAFIILATVINGALGLWLKSQGRRHHSFILEANGQHVLTDCITSLCVVVGLISVELTQYFWLDPIIGIAAALHIFFSGGRLVLNSIGGLMDSCDMELDSKLRQLCALFAEEHQIEYHHLRHRQSGRKTFLEIHLLFPDETSLIEAHAIATEFEAFIHRNSHALIDITTHLEPKEQHDAVHAAFSTGY